MSPWRAILFPFWDQIYGNERAKIVAVNVKYTILGAVDRIVGLGGRKASPELNPVNSKQNDPFGNRETGAVLHPLAASHHDGAEAGG